MNRKVIKYNWNEMEVYLDPNSVAYKMYKEKNLGDLDRHLESIMRKK